MPPAEPAGHERAEPVRADGQAGTDRVVPTVRAAHHGPRHRAAVVQQRLQAGALADVGAGLARRAHQSGVEDAPGEREPGGAKRPRLRLAEESGEPAPAGADDRGALQRHGAGGLEVGHDAEPVQQADRLGAHVLGAGLVTGELGAIDHHDTPARLRQVHRGRAAGRSGAGDQDIGVGGAQDAAHPAAVAASDASAFTPSFDSHGSPPTGRVAWPQRCTLRSLDRSQRSQ